MAAPVGERLPIEEFRRLLRRVDRSDTWGLDDELGALRFIGPDQRLAALATVRVGEVVSCAAAWHNDRPGRPGSTQLSVRTEQAGAWLAVNEHLSIDLHGRNSMTHLDALGHFFFDATGYGGAPASVVGPDGTSRHSVASAADGIVARGVLLDLMSMPRTTDPSAPVRVEEVLAYLQRERIHIDRGDVLFVRAGPRPREEPFTAGLHIGCAEWLHDSGIAVVVTDHGLDCDADQVQDVATPWHVATLTRMGVRLVDLADLEALAGTSARHGRRVFLAVLAALPLHGATSSPINPLALF
ncbi:cyclase family protein [Pseudonocardia sp. DSM 110487]|uniref:cyclase family protein n=1 Tax=Pseudonocardia sp. DSM 110487 TaxID=2865833 RepID=UPI001C6A1D4D|nr:cyclase family protein [Pseudonocardia sp. DSM 110487]QYN33498.1 cyclase family protein [Pseudonocardia sp. DSM 110487]